MYQLSYTRGTIVPCSILISTSDTQALDLLATPSAIVLSLVCNMYARSAKHEKREANSKRPHREPSTFEIDKRHLQRAQWWPAPESHLDGTRRLMGEIHVSPGLKPAMLTPEFKTYVRRMVILPWVKANTNNILESSTQSAYTHLMRLDSCRPLEPRQLTDRSLQRTIMTCCS